MAWTWQLCDRTGTALDVAGAAASFPTQSDAESWLGEQWPELLEVGVDEVILLEEGRAVYGPMSLHVPQG